MATTYIASDLPTLNKDLTTCKANKLKYEKAVSDYQANYDRDRKLYEEWFALYQSRKNRRQEELDTANYYNNLAAGELVNLNISKANLQTAIDCITEKQAAINGINTTGSYTTVPTSTATKNLYIGIGVAVVVIIIIIVILRRKK